MDLGARLRQARVDAGLSQRQLCGEEITRNMLSQIENGSARPSMDTLRYLAGRLGKPMSYFLEEQAVTSPNQEIMAWARGAFSAGDARRCLEALESYRGPDGVFDQERWLLEALALMALAEASMDRPAYASSLLDRAGRAGKETAYYSDALERKRLLLRYRAEPEAAREIVSMLPDHTPELLARGAAALLVGKPEQAAALLDAAQGPQDTHWHLLRGDACLALGDYAGAVPHYALAEPAYPKQVLPKLEECYQALKDYEQAYRCALKRRELGI